MKELFEIYDYQRQLKIPSKCGIETRPFVHGNYGAYWYNNSREEGFERKESLLKDFPKIPTILKRGCTEFEMSHGPSDRWRQPKRIQRLEKKLDEIIVHVCRENAGVVKEEDGKPSPWYINEHVKRRWIEFAYDRGDPTYKLFTRGQPLMKPVITYDRELENGCQVDKLIKLAK